MLGTTFRSAADRVLCEDTFALGDYRRQKRLVETEPKEMFLVQVVRSDLDLCFDLPNLPARPQSDFQFRLMRFENGRAFQLFVQGSQFPSKAQEADGIEKRASNHHAGPSLRDVCRDSQPVAVPAIHHLWILSAMYPKPKLAQLDRGPSVCFELHRCPADVCLTHGFSHGGSQHFTRRRRLQVEVRRLR